MKLKTFYLFMIAFTVLFCTYKAAAQETWHREILAASHYFTAMGPDSLCLDSAGNPALAYGGNGLFFARYKGTYWTLETVDESPKVGKFTSLKFDDGGNAHIAYKDWIPESNSETIGYAVKTGETWHVESVPVLSTDIGSFSFDLDGNGKPWLAYFDNAGDTVNLIHKDNGGSWIREPIFLALEPIWNIELVMDGTNPIFVYASGASDPVLRLGYPGVSGYEYLNIDTGPVSVTHLDMALDGSGFVHICYKTISPDALKYITFQPGGWPSVPEIVDDIGDEPGQYPSIDLHPITGNPVISYVVGATSTALKTAERDGIGWEISTIATSGEAVRFTSAVQLENGHHHVTFYDEETKSLSHVFSAGGSPVEKIIDLIRLYGDPMDSGSNPAGNVSLVFTDKVDYKLCLLTQRSGTWRAGEITGIYEPLYRISADISARGYLGIVWTSEFMHSITTAYLTLSEQSDTGWIHETVDPEPIPAGVFTEMKWDQTGKPHILYRTDGPSLRHAYRAESGWLFSEIFSGHPTDYHLDIHSDGTVHLIYTDPTTDTVHHVQSTDMTSWTDSVVIADGDPSGESIICLDVMGEPHIMYMDPDMQAIRHFWRDQSTWNDEALPGTESHKSLQWDYGITTAGEHHLVYWNYETRDLRHYRRSDGAPSWTYDIVDNRYLNVDTVSLTFDPLNRPEITYYDAVNDKIYLAWLRPPVWYDLGMAVTRMLPGREFQLTRKIHNTGANQVLADEYILLDVYGEYWFAPDWTQTPDFTTLTVPSETEHFIIPLEFTWPDGAGAAWGIRFWGGIVESGTSTLIDYDMVVFQWDY